MQAVILAAGMGTRIRDHFVLPKGFIPLGEEPIICASIRKLKQAGISKIFIIAGHLAHHYQKLAETDPAITVVVNEKYNVFGSLYSLYCAKDLVTENCLILESDIFYEDTALSHIINHKQQNAILLSGKTNSGDEVYVQANNQQLVNMSKQPDSLDKKTIYGEFVGINKLSYSAFSQLIQLLETDSNLLQNGHYEENGLVTLAEQCAISCLKIPELLWCEIDNITQLKSAERIYNQVTSKQKRIPSDVIN